jgi:hypothetical protein
VTAVANDLSRRRPLDPGLVAWLPVLFFVILCLALRGSAPWLSLFPADWVLPIAAGVDAVSTAVTEFV